MHLNLLFCSAGTTKTPPLAGLSSRMLYCTAWPFLLADPHPACFISALTAMPLMQHLTLGLSSLFTFLHQRDPCCGLMNHTQHPTELLMAGEMFHYMGFTFQSTLSPKTSALPLSVPKYYCWHTLFMEDISDSAFFLHSTTIDKNAFCPKIFKEYFKSVPQTVLISRNGALIPNLPQNLTVEI